MEEKITNEELEEYVREALWEEIIRGIENDLLSVLKDRQNKYPSERNDGEWLAFSNFVCRRRCQRTANEKQG